MKRVLATLVLCAVVGGCSSLKQSAVGTPAPASGSAAAASPAELPLLDFKQSQESFLSAYAKLASLTSDPVTCETNPCPVPVNLYNGPSPQDSTQTICLAQVPASIDVKGLGKRGPVTLVWQLIQKGISVSGFTYGFEPNYGILLLSNPAGGLSKPKSGDGGANPGSDQYFNATARPRRPQTAAYFPIVLQTAVIPTVPPKSADMCAATDPVIVNSD